MTATTAPVTIPSDLDDTARLILMDQPDISAPMLRRALRTEGVDTTLEEITAIWRRYRGRSGRGGHSATHDVETGERVR